MASILSQPLAPRLGWALSLALIPLTSLFGPFGLDLYRQALGTGNVEWAVGGLLLAGLAAGSWGMVREGHGRWGSTALAFVVVAGLLVGVPAGPRWMHLVLFLPFGLFSARVWGVRRAGWLVLLVAAGDELLQFTLADRTGSPLDVGINVAAAGSGILLARSPPSRLPRPASLGD